MNPYTPPISLEKARERAQKICAALSLEEKADFVQGYQHFFIRPLPEHGVPAIYMTDASMGIHIRPDLETDLISQPQRSVSYPCFITLAASWNPQLAADYGRSVGEECRAAGIHVLLGPAFNLYRSSQNGRNFEYLGEDPFLVSRLVEAYVPAMQQTGTMATIKHFICNNSEFYRRRSNSVVSERAVQELYLPGFRAGVNAGAMAVMTSYNQLNGEWCGQSSEVINGLLREDLGFKWLVMSDWTSIWDSAKMIRSGQDLDMPGPAVDNIVELVESKKVAESDLDRMVISVMTSCIAMGFYDRDQKDDSFAGKDREHEAVALETARQGIVLLKNNGILPLGAQNSFPKIQPDASILAIGDFLDTIPAGGGAAFVEGYDQVILSQALQQEFGSRITINAGATDSEIQKASAVILSIGTLDSEGWDRPFELPVEQTERIRKICDLNSNTIVVINSGSGIGMQAWKEQAAAILYGWYPGQNGNIAMAEILSGKTNPSGKLPISIEKDFADSPAAGYLPEGEELYHDWPQNELEHPVFDIEYQEDIFVGYRWYDSKQIEPLFPFGHGLSYTIFRYDGLKITQCDDADCGCCVGFTIYNDGPCDGYETAQVYISQQNPGVPHPPKELKGFSKLQIPAGEHREVQICLAKRDFAYFDPEKSRWVVPRDSFRILIGASSRDIRLEGQCLLD